jgi:hypothetical protein
MTPHLEDKGERLIIYLRTCGRRHFGCVNYPSNQKNCLKKIQRETINEEEINLPDFDILLII